MAWHGMAANEMGVELRCSSRRVVQCLQAQTEGCNAKNTCTQQCHEQENLSEGHKNLRGGKLPSILQNESKVEGGRLGKRGREGKGEGVTASLYFSVSIAMRFNFKILQGCEIKPKVVRAAQSNLTCLWWCRHST
jgi:hypothetical protein